jgi:hypothetical protein
VQFMVSFGGWGFHEFSVLFVGGWWGVGRENSCGPCSVGLTARSSLFHSITEADKLSYHEAVRGRVVYIVKLLTTTYAR